MLPKTYLICFIAILFSQSGLCQATRTDTVPSANDETLAIDLSLDYDEVLDELGNFWERILCIRHDAQDSHAAIGEVVGESLQPGGIKFC